MTILYNCKHAGDEYRITKFDDNDPVASYLCTFENCDCPAGPRPTCRHRQMLPLFIAREAVDTGWWHDYDRGGWVDMQTPEEIDHNIALARQSQQERTTFAYMEDGSVVVSKPHSTAVSAEDFESSDVGSNPTVAANWRRF